MGGNDKSQGTRNEPSADQLELERLRAENEQLKADKADLESDNLQLREKAEAGLNGEGSQMGAFPRDTEMVAGRSPLYAFVCKVTNPGRICTQHGVTEFPPMTIRATDEIEAKRQYVLKAIGRPIDTVHAIIDVKITPEDQKRRMDYAAKCHRQRLIDNGLNDMGIPLSTAGATGAAA